MVPGVELPSLPPKAHHPQKPNLPGTPGAGPQRARLLQVPEKPVCHCSVFPYACVAGAIESAMNTRSVIERMAMSFTLDLIFKQDPVDAMVP